MKARKLFTIVELLVVIAIINILSSLMLPAIQKSISQGKRSFCANNLKQFGIASINYSSENDNYVLPANFGNTSAGGYNHWLNYLASNNLATADSIKCPAMSEGEFFDPAGHDPLTGNIYTEASYIMNIISKNNWNSAMITSDPAKTFGWGENSISPVKIQAVSKPEEKLYIMDATKNLSNSHSGINEFAKTDYGMPVDPPTGSVRWVGYQHFNGFNAVFGDGHSSSLLKSNHKQWAVSVDKN